MGRFAKLEKHAPNATAPAVPEAGEQMVNAVSSSSNDDYPTFLAMADDAFFSGQYRDALRHYSRALQRENAQVYPWIGQISALLELKQYREAELWSNRALEQFPEEPSLLSQRARVLAATGNIKRALGVSDYAMTQGTTSWCWLARGEVLLEAKDANALFCFEKAAELAGPQDWRTPLQSGLCFARRRQWSNAEDFLRRSIAINPRHAFTWYELARVHLELGQTDLAIDAVGRSIQLNPDFRPAHLLKESIYRQPFLKRLLSFFRR